MKRLGYYNGTFGELETMTVPMNDRACYFGDGVYEASLCRNHKIFALDEHMDRLFNSAALLRIEIEQSKEEIKAILNEMVAKVETSNNMVYWQITRGTGPRGHAFLTDVKSNLWITVTPKEVMNIYQKVNLITLDDTRFLHCNIKSLNLLPAVMASQKAKEAGCHEAVLHRNGRVTECAHSNVHILKDGILYTAPTDHLILPGITRAHIIKACKKLCIGVDETPFTLDEMMNADEIFTSASSAPCMAAKEIDGKPVGGKAPELLKMIQDEILREFMEETEA